MKRAPLFVTLVAVSLAIAGEPGLQLLSFAWKTGTLLAVYVDPSFLTGSLHHEGGIVFFLLGLVLLMPVLRLLRRTELNKTEPPPARMALSAKHSG
jgi:hypothetical protein